MKRIWLPSSLYRIKPLLIGLAGAIILYVSNGLFTTFIAVVCLGYAGWIILIRLMWSTASVIKTRYSTNNAGEPKTHFVRYPDKSG